MLGSEDSLVCTESQQQCVAKACSRQARASKRNHKRLDSLLRAEEDYQPTPSFLKNVQSCVDISMRARVVEMMLEGTMVSGEQETNSDVFQASCNLLDRYLSKKAVHDEMDLIAVAGACVMISSKFRNGACGDHVFGLTAYFPCSFATLINKEVEVCHWLKWNIYCVTPSDFIDVLLDHLDLPSPDMSQQICRHAYTLSDFAVSDYRLIGHPPSLIACGAICSAINTLLHDHIPVYMKQLIGLTGIEQESLQQCQHSIDNCFEERVQQCKGQDSVDGSGTPTEIGQLFFQEYQKPSSKQLTISQSCR